MTLIGSAVGAFIGAMGALFVTKMQLIATKRERMKEKDFEFRKVYYQVNNSVVVCIRRIKYVIEEKMISDTGLEANIKFLETVVLYFNKLPIELIPENKYKNFMVCYSNLLDFKTILINYQDGISYENKDLTEIKKTLESVHIKLKE